jgi:hypothetical protein
MSMNYIEQRATALGQGNPEKKKEWIALLDRIIENTGILNWKIREPLPRKLAYFDLVCDCTGFINLNPGFHLFNDSLSAFRELYSIQNPANSQKSYDHLISMVGLSLEPVMHTILTLCPKSITLCVTEESKEIGSAKPTIEFIRHAINKFRTDTSYNPDIDVLLIDHSDTAKVFAKVNGKMNGWLKESKNVALDITGGKKSMDVTAFLAATMYQGIDIYYVDFEGYEYGHPIYGTEFLSKLVNPYHFFSIREKQLIFELWSRKNYAEVEKQLEDILDEDKFSESIARKYKLTDERRVLENLQEAAACYDAWRKYDYYTAFRHGFDGDKVFHEKALEDLVCCSMGYGKKLTSKYSDAISALKLAIDRYVRGGDAVSCQEWNRAALCFAQALEALIRYAIRQALATLVLKDQTFPDAFAKKPYNYSANALLQILFKNINPKNHNKPVFYTEEGDYYFSDSGLYSEIDEKVLKKRNELSHFECIVSEFPDEDGLENAEKTNVPDYLSLMGEMAVTVERFFLVFAAKHDISAMEIENFKKLVTFCSLDEHLILRKPAILFDSASCA